jgi:hypothetical protein
MITIFKILTEMPSRSVAFFILIFLICFIMKSSFISWNTKFSISGVLAIIFYILGWLWSDFILLDTISLATFIKKILKISDASVWSFIILLSSSNIISFLQLLFLLDRPVSILPVISKKKIERAINDQLVFYFSKHFHPYLSAFRSGYGCQTALYNFI